MNVLEVKDVRKRLGKRDIIRDITFSVKEGEIFGFLGPNGAGKTTTIRMMVGLIAPNSGSITIMGHDIQRDRESALKEIGAVVENPEMYTYLSGRENLMQVARIRKINKSRVEEIIQTVGLTDRIDDKVSKYSLGMKQRIGLAVALLSKPKLLILDEPTNGLDPSGIMDFRNIVKKASKENGSAVFISSHILSEVQQLCDRVAFINNGVIQAVESINGSSERKVETIVLSVKDKEKCKLILEDLPYIIDVNDSEDSFVLKVDKDSTPRLIFKLSQEKISVNEVYKKHTELEERYMELVEGGKRV